MQKGKRTPKSEASSKVKKSIDPDSWRQALNEIAINDGEWWCIVIMMVETITEHSRCVSLFNAAAEEGKRKAIYSLSRRRALASVRALSKQSLDKCPAIQGVCHYTSKVLNGDNDALPSWLMAQIIKYLIYRAREESIGIVKRLADLEREIDEEYWIMQTVADWGQPGAKKIDLEKFNRKANTKLRKRDEEWRDTVYVDDAPLNGPNLYIILSGFHNPDLPQHLINAGVPVRCMMQIKRPNEHLCHPVRCKSSETETPEIKKLTFLENYVVNATALFEFWTKVEDGLMHPETHPEYNDIAFLRFCPPEFPKTSTDEEYEIQKKDMYDRVSYIVFDFYDLYRQHGNYLKSMKMDRAIVRETTEQPNLDTYGKLLDLFPMECTSVPIILFAILMQVEENERKIVSKNSIDEKGDAKIVTGSAATLSRKGTATQKASITIESSFIGDVPFTNDTTLAFISEKIKNLNVKFNLSDVEYNVNDSEQKIAEIPLTLHGDTLQEAIRLLKNPETIGIANKQDLVNNILSIFWSPSIVNMYDQNKLSKKKVEDYNRHLDNVRDYFFTKISDEEVRHYLHILMFDRMIFEPLKSKNEALIDSSKNETVDAMYNYCLTSSMKRSKSLPSLTSKPAPESHVPSDSNIDYDKLIPAFVECSSLFNLADPRELLNPGYLQETIFKNRPTNVPSLEDFNDVELLSRPIFLKLLHECLLSFDHVQLRYFEPTDSLLLYFGNKWRINGVHKEERMSSIRTPVRLRDFCKYVVPEEKDWLRREEELYRLQTAGSMERLMRKSMEIYDETMLFRDEDFILPGTLKARDLEKNKKIDQQKSATEMAVVSQTSVKETVKGTKKGTEKSVSEKGKTKGSKFSGSKGTKKLATDQESAAATQKASTVRIVEPEATHDFIGYDLGNLRVQVTNRKRTFCSADGTLVQIEIDDWLYQQKDIRIAITINGYTLRLFHRIGAPEKNDVFHLTTKSGIILAFQRLMALENESEVPFQRNWWDINVQFRASWPTGLLIEPIIGDGPENPYYIQQSYIPSGCECINGNREVCRKFLRNGTVIKYLDNNNIIVLCPNGVVVTCTAFERQETKQNVSKSGFGRSTGELTSKESKFPVKAKTKPFSSSPQLDGTGERGPAQQNSTTIHRSALSMADCTVKVSRYTVVDHDGRRYEVADDLIVSEQHRLLVRMASDYEVDEKFTRRADDTNMLLNSNGELIVGFPDGTRITTGYTIENEAVMCDWTEEDILRYFTWNGIKEEEEPYVDASSLNLASVENGSSRRNAWYEEKIAELLITDSFVSILLTCRAEHKNYATVSYDQLAVSCTLSMPDDLRVSISGRGHYEVSMEGGVNLQIKEDDLSFRGNSCTICGNQSTSIYTFLPLELSAIIFTTIDTYGNTFELKNDGTTNYFSKKQKTSLKVNFDDLDDAEEQCNETHDGEDIIEDECCHERLCFEGSSLGYRIFSINRKLTAYEYIHRFTRNQAEIVAAFDNKTSIILYSNSHRPKLQRLVTCEPVGAVSLSKDILSFPDFRVKPTNFDRRDLLRSTYSIPYDWLFPFGRKGDGVWKNTHDLPIIASVETLPELLRIRVLRGFKEPGANAVIDLQRALSRYWMSIIREVAHLPDTTNDRQEIGQAGSKSAQDDLDDKLCSLALGTKKTIDVETYKIGLGRSRNVSKARARQRSLKVEEFRLHKSEIEEQLKWYKRCMREKFILPYFENIRGTCFLFVMDCFDDAMKSISTLSLQCRGYTYSNSSRDDVWVQF